jgi:hypothetical protein
MSGQIIRISIARRFFGELHAHAHASRRQESGHKVQSRPHPGASCVAMAHIGFANEISPARTRPRAANFNGIRKRNERPERGFVSYQDSRTAAREDLTLLSSFSFFYI